MREKLNFLGGEIKFNKDSSTEKMVCGESKQIMTGRENKWKQ